jgi:hypothetical protein
MVCVSISQTMHVSSWILKTAFVAILIVYSALGLALYPLVQPHPVHALYYLSFATATVLVPHPVSLPIKDPPKLFQVLYLVFFAAFFITAYAAVIIECTQLGSTPLDVIIPLNSSTVVEHVGLRTVQSALVGIAVALPVFFLSMQLYTWVAPKSLPVTITGRSLSLLDGLLWILIWVLLWTEVSWTLARPDTTWQVVDTPFLVLYCGFMLNALHPTHFAALQILILGIGLLFSTVYIVLNILSVETFAKVADLQSYENAFEGNRSLPIRDLYVIETPLSIDLVASTAVGRDVLDLIALTLGWTLVGNKIGALIDA